MCGLNKKRRSGRVYTEFNIKGQFTIFIILGLVIMFVFGFALYARARIVSSQLGSQADAQLKNYLTNNAIDQYVTTCLDAVTEEVFLTASMQGGLLNSTDKIANKDYISYYNEKLNRTFNVSIIIDANYNCPDNRPLNDYIVTEEPGLYPYNCADEYVKNLPSIYTTYGNNKCQNNCTGLDFFKYSGFFGINNMTMLCNPNGANAPGIVSGPNSISCDYYDYYGVSMQQRLEEKIARDISKCVNFNEILNRTPSNITNIGSANATIQFNQKGFNVKLSYPFTITLRNRQPVTKMVDFSVDKDIPFKELYEYAYELANYDVKDARFDVIVNRDQVLSKSLRRRGINLFTSNFDVNIIYGNTSNGFTNIIQVSDNNYNITGVPLTINLGVKNRRPVLDYIHSGDSPRYDLVAVENRTIVIAPQGYDPDDESVLTYNYGEWLERYTDYYNWSDPNCSNPSTFEYILENCTKINTTGIPNKDWTKSLVYTLTHQNASYDIKRSDVGLHTVRVSVFDRNNLEDYQLVRILVFDLPVARINGSNDYKDIDDRRASYEDTYLLNGAESTVGAIASTLNVPFTTFLWNDTKEPFAREKIIHENDPNTKKLIIPNDREDQISPPNIFNIMNITSYMFKKQTEPYNIHNISLTVNTQTGLHDTNTFFVNVTQCLNHSSPNGMPSYPYDTLPPYNVAVDNITAHLQANHTCCANTLTYKGTDQICFNSSKYGMNLTLRDFTKTIEPPKVNRITYSFGQEVVDKTKVDNDIFLQEFTRSCSGDRGNICNGTGTETRTDAVPCQDNNKISDSNFQKERCSGPPSGTGNTPNLFLINASSNTKPSCENYSVGKTFEKLYSALTTVSPGTGTCTSAPQCSDGSTFRAYNSDPSGMIAKYLCNGQCSGDGKCNKANSCKCSTLCNFPSQTTGLVDSLCNGVDIGQISTVNSCSAGKDYIQDECSECGLIDVPGGACNSDNGCTADSQCNGAPPNSVLASYPLGNIGCNATCKSKDCGLYKYSTSGNGGCPSTCNANTDCTTNSYCNKIIPSHQCQLISSIPCIINGVIDPNVCTNLLDATYTCTAGRCVKI